MRFTFEGTTYEIVFSRHYKKVNADGRKDFSAYPYTTANILVVDESKKRDKWEVFRTYTVGCHKRDNFTLESGRKAALTLAVYDEPFVRGLHGILVRNDGTLSRDFKRAMWTAYHGRPGSKVTLPKA